MTAPPQTAAKAAWRGSAAVEPAAGETSPAVPRPCDPWWPPVAAVVADSVRRRTPPKTGVHFLTGAATAVAPRALHFRERCGDGTWHAAAWPGAARPADLARGNMPASEAVTRHPFGRTDFIPNGGG